MTQMWSDATCWRSSDVNWTTVLVANTLPCRLLYMYTTLGSAENLLLTVIQWSPTFKTCHTQTIISMHDTVLYFEIFNWKQLPTHVRFWLNNGINGRRETKEILKRGWPARINIYSYSWWSCSRAVVTLWLLLSCAKSHMLSASRLQPHLLHVSAVDRHQIWSMYKSWRCVTLSGFLQSLECELNYSVIINWIFQLLLQLTWNRYIKNKGIFVI